MTEFYLQQIYSQELLSCCSDMELSYFEMRRIFMVETVIPEIL